MSSAQAIINSLKEHYKHNISEVSYEVFREGVERQIFVIQNETAHTKQIANLLKGAAAAVFLGSLLASSPETAVLSVALGAVAARRDSKIKVLTQSSSDAQKLVSSEETRLIKDSKTGQHFDPDAKVAPLTDKEAEQGLHSQYGIELDDDLDFSPR
jgi:hypothetical protein